MSNQDPETTSKTAESDFFDFKTKEPTLSTPVPIPLEEKIMFTENHCRAFDVLKTFNLDHFDHTPIKPLPSLEFLKKTLEQNPDSVLQIKKQVAHFTGHSLGEYKDKGDLLVGAVTNYFITMNQTLADLKIWSENATYVGRFRDLTGVPDSSVSVKSTCDKWLEINNSKLVQNSFKEVMLPSLGVFSLLTLVLYFISLYTDKEHIKKCKKSATHMRSSFKKSIRSSVRNSARSFNSRLHSNSNCEEPLNESNQGNNSDQQFFDSSGSNNEMCSTNVNEIVSGSVSGSGTSGSRSMSRGSRWSRGSSSEANGSGSGAKGNYTAVLQEEKP